MPSNDQTIQQLPIEPADEGTNGGTPDAERYERIDQVAARTGLTKRTLRYYEEIGLLAAPTRTEGGYRLYSEHDVQQLERIKRLRDLLGFSLAEIRDMAEAEEEREQVRYAWKHETEPHARLEWLDRAEANAKKQLALIEEKLNGLRDMQSQLQGRLDRVQKYREDTLAELGDGANGRAAE